MEEFTTDSRDEVLRLLSDIHARECTYHNHKETSAWAATAVYAAFVASTFRLFPHAVGSCSPIWYAAYVLTLAAVVVCYVFIQFRACRWASAYVAASDFVRMDIISKPPSQFDSTEFAPTPLTGEKGHYFNTWVPKRLSSEIDRVHQQGQDTRSSLSALAYGFIAIVTVGALLFALGA